MTHKEYLKHDTIRKMKYLLIRDEFWAYEGFIIFCRGFLHFLYILQKYIQQFFIGLNSHVLFMWQRFRRMITCIKNGIFKHLNSYHHRMRLIIEVWNEYSSLESEITVEKTHPCNVSCLSVRLSACHHVTFIELLNDFHWWLLTKYGHIIKFWLNPAKNGQIL